MKVYTTAEGRVRAEAESIKDIRKLLALDTTAIEKARAVLAEKPISRRGARYTKTHACGMKYKYLKRHLKHCTLVPITITRV